MYNIVLVNTPYFLSGIRSTEVDIVVTNTYLRVVRILFSIASFQNLTIPTNTYLSHYCSRNFLFEITFPLSVLEYVGPKWRTFVANMSIAMFFTFAACVLPWIAYFLADWRMTCIATSVPLAFSDSDALAGTRKCSMARESRSSGEGYQYLK